MKLRRRRPPLPEPPENVRVLYQDSRAVPVECVYAGRGGGMHHWRAVNPVPLEFGMSVTCDRLPPRTSILVVAEGAEWFE